MSCQYQGTPGCGMPGVNMRQEKLCSLSCAFAFSHSIGSGCQYSLLKEEIGKSQSISLSGIIPAKHFARFNKNGLENTQI